VSAVPLGPTDALLASAVLAYAVALSWRQGLGLEGTIAWGALRALVQLSLLGWVLTRVIQADSPLIVGLVLLVMALLGGAAARQRIKRPLPHAQAICFAGIASAAALVLPVMLVLVLRPHPWFSPQLVVPIGGLVIGSTMTGTFVALDRLLAEAARRRAQIEAALALGATPRQAARACVAQATQAAMIAPINNLMITGLIQIPGVTTGLVIAGADPELGVRYSLVVSYAIVSSVAITATVTSALGARQLFTARGQLRHDVLDEPAASA
jgi:putative ABC transport system permease protein